MAKKKKKKSPKKVAEKKTPKKKAKKKKGTVRSTSSKRTKLVPQKHPPDLSLASLYAKIYLQSQDLLNASVKLDERWKDVPILMSESTKADVTIRELEGIEAEFYVAVPSKSHSDRYEKRNDGNWYAPFEKSADQLDWMRDVLIRHQWYLSLIHI